MSYALEKDSLILDDICTGFDLLQNLYTTDAYAVNKDKIANKIASQIKSLQKSQLNQSKDPNLIFLPCRGVIYYIPYGYISRNIYGSGFVQALTKPFTPLSPEEIAKKAKLKEYKPPVETPQKKKNAAGNPRAEKINARNLADVLFQVWFETDTPLTVIYSIAGAFLKTDAKRMTFAATFNNRAYCYAVPTHLSNPDHKFLNAKRRNLSYHGRVPMKNRQYAIMPNNNIVSTKGGNLSIIDRLKFAEVQEKSPIGLAKRSTRTGVFTPNKTYIDHDEEEKVIEPAICAYREFLNFAFDLKQNMYSSVNIYNSFRDARHESNVHLKDAEASVPPNGMWVHSVTIPTKESIDRLHILLLEEFPDTAWPGDEEMFNRINACVKDADIEYYEYRFDSPVSKYKYRLKNNINADDYADIMSIGDAWKNMLTVRGDIGFNDDQMRFTSTVTATTKREITEIYKLMNVLRKNNPHIGSMLVAYGLLDKDSNYIPEFSGNCDIMLDDFASVNIINDDLVVQYLEEVQTMYDKYMNYISDKYGKDITDESQTDHTIPYEYRFGVMLRNEELMDFSDEQRCIGHSINKIIQSMSWTTVDVLSHHIELFTDKLHDPKYRDKIERAYDLANFVASKFPANTRFVLDGSGSLWYTDDTNYDELQRMFECKKMTLYAVMPELIRMINDIIREDGKDDAGLFTLSEIITE